MFRPFFLVFFFLLLVENWNFLTRQISIHHRAQEFSFNVYHSHQIEFSLTGFSDFFSPLTNTKLYISSIQFWRCLYLSWDTAVLEREASQKKIYFFPSSLCKHSESFPEKKRTLFFSLTRVHGVCCVWLGACGKAEVWWKISSIDSIITWVATRVATDCGRDAIIDYGGSEKFPMFFYDLISVRIFFSSFVWWRRAIHFHYD